MYRVGQASDNHWPRVGPDITYTINPRASNDYVQVLLMLG